MDFYLPDVSMAKVREIALRLQRGGVGYYPTSYNPFVHLDAGSVRHWPRMTRDQLARVFPDGKTVHIPTDGKPMERYDEALAEIEANGGVVAPTPMPATAAASSPTARARASSRRCSAARRTTRRKQSGRLPAMPALRRARRWPRWRQPPQLSYAPQAYNGESDRSTPYFGNTTISPSRPSARIAPAPVRQAFSLSPIQNPSPSRPWSPPAAILLSRSPSGTRAWREPPVRPPPRSPKRRRGSPWFPYRPRGRPTCCRPSSRPCRCRRPGRSCWPPPSRGCPAPRRSRIASAGRDHGRNQADVCDLSLVYAAVPLPMARPAGIGGARIAMQPPASSVTAAVAMTTQPHAEAPQGPPSLDRFGITALFAHAATATVPPRARRSGWPWPARSRPTRISPRTP